MRLEIGMIGYAREELAVSLLVVEDGEEQF